ncbi:MAG TPA: hypothetical protein VNQ76_21220 [Planctomicrobium sp.]|nr:hypothetical protein [Planctomicrobium sp.]
MNDARLLTKTEIDAAYGLFETFRSARQLDIISDYVLIHNLTRKGLPPYPTIEKFVSLRFLICVPNAENAAPSVDENSKVKEWNWSGEFRPGPILSEFFVDPDWKWWSPSLKPSDWTMAYKEETKRSITTTGMRLWRDKGQVKGHPENNKAGVRLFLSDLEQKMPQYVAEIRMRCVQKIETQSKLIQT